MLSSASRVMSSLESITKLPDTILSSEVIVKSPDEYVTSDSSFSCVAPASVPV